jgi:hypothetical protein
MDVAGPSGPGLGGTPGGAYAANAHAPPGDHDGLRSLIENGLGAGDLEGLDERDVDELLGDLGSLDGDGAAAAGAARAARGRRKPEQRRRRVGTGALLW